MRNALMVLVGGSLIVLSACNGGTEAAPESSGPGSQAAGEPVDLSDVDACSLLDVATVQEITGESVDFDTQDMSDGVTTYGCFWGATVPGVGAYVEITLSPRNVGLEGYEFLSDQGCSESSIEGVGTEARGGTCPGDPQPKVYVVAYDPGVLVTVLVNDPARPLEPDDLVATARELFEQI